MRLRTFQATSMAEAMEAIRQAMGEDAVILSTETVGKGVSVTVAIDADDEDERYIPLPQAVSEPLYKAPVNTAKAESTAPSSNRADISAARQQQLREMEAVLRYHGMPNTIVEKLLETGRFLPLPPGLNFGGVKRALTQVLDVFVQFAPLHLEDDHRIMLVGPPGVGKTMTIAKIAARLKMDKKQFHIITTDNIRAGGIEQLQTLTTIMDAQLHVAEDKAQLKQILAALPAADCTLIDTAGVNPYEAEELKELAGLLSVSTIEPILVLPAGMDAQECEFAARAFRVVADVKRMLVTRTDAARRYGSVITASHAIGAALSHASGSAKVVGDFITLNAEVFSGMLMQYRLENSEKPGSISA